MHPKICLQNFHAQKHRQFTIFEFISIACYGILEFLFSTAANETSP